MHIWSCCLSILSCTYIYLSTDSLCIDFLTTITWYIHWVKDNKTECLKSTFRLKTYWFKNSVWCQRPLYTCHVFQCSHLKPTQIIVILFYFLYLNIIIKVIFSHKMCSAILCCKIFTNSCLLLFYINSIQTSLSGLLYLNCLLEFCIPTARMISTSHNNKILTCASCSSKYYI